MAVEVRILRLPNGEGLPLPTYASAGAAGADVCAAIERDLEIGPGERLGVPTGLVLEIPEGFEVQVRPRSGLAVLHGLTVANAPGTIDSDYRGEVKVLLVNLGNDPVRLRRGDRIAQLVIAPVQRARFREVNEVGETERGTGGFGSTGG
jgi:dUTP pyrophosphatase